MPAARLRDRTDRAIAAGVFGVPTLVTGDELFWGYDDLPWLDRHLAGTDPLDLAGVPDESTRPHFDSKLRIEPSRPDPGDPATRPGSRSSSCSCSGGKAARLMV